MQSHKSWGYTLNNYTEDEVAQFKAFICNRHRCAKEVGVEGTPHLQGTITFEKTCRLSALKKLNSRAHWYNILPKNLTASYNYCTKGEIIIDINNTNQGKRTDIEDAMNLLKETRNMRAVALEFPVVYIKMHKGMQAWLKETIDLPDIFPCEVIVIWGKSGAGKSRKAREIDPKLYNMPEPINGTVWFDGYKGQETVLLDDFYGWLKYHTLLQMTDIYNMQMPVKGSFIDRQWKRVIITSNSPPEEWYNREEITALQRRIHKVIQL